MEFIKPIVIAAVVIGVFGLVVGTLLAFWWLWLGLAVIGGGGFIYWKRQKRAQNLV